MGCIDDQEILIAALLHDTIEDTNTAPEEIIAEFGARVASLVLECTDDKTCNLRSILSDPPKGWSLDRQQEYFLWAQEVVSGLLGVNQALDDFVQSVLQQGLQKLSQAEPGGEGP